MNLHFKRTNCGTDARLENYIEEKLAFLHKFQDQAELVGVEIEKIAHHKTGAVCRIEVNVKQNGKVYRAEATEDTFEAAIDLVKDELIAELRKVQGKRHSLWRNGARRLKEMMRRGE
jgi:ribosomal subunit interface protein